MAKVCVVVDDDGGWEAGKTELRLTDFALLWSGEWEAGGREWGDCGLWAAFLPLLRWNRTECVCVVLAVLLNKGGRFPSSGQVSPDPHRRTGATTPSMDGPRILSFCEWYGPRRPTREGRR